MQDNAPAHRAFVTRDWLRANNVQVFGPWSAKSPDMNPIENLWAQMETSLQNRQHKPRNRDELWQTVQQIWNNINLFDADAATPRFKQQDITPVTDFLFLFLVANKKE